MELYLQFGYGMMEHCRVLLSSWGGGTVILSPRDLKENQMIRLGSDLASIRGAEAMVDPQFYLPHADHEKLCQHSYWPVGYETAVFWQGPALTSLLRELQSLNSKVGCSRFLLPGLFASVVDEDWFETQQAVLAAARAIETDRPLVLTVALSSDVVRNADQISALVERAESWKVSGYYVVCEHPNGDYLVRDPNWIANVLDLCSGLKLSGASVILGYCTHQMLVAASAKVDAIASGTWMNVRSFPPEKFNTYEEEIRQRTTWYYCPQALSEYKIPFLDIAHRVGVLPLMAPAPNVDGGYVTNLFRGAQPSTVGFNEQSAFRHYLHAVHEQVRLLPQNSFDSVTVAHETLMKTAEELLARLRAVHVSGDLRDFRDIVEVNRSGVGLFTALRAPVMRRKWDSI